MTTATRGEIYKGYLIQRDAFRWVVKGGRFEERFKTKKAAMDYVDRNPKEGGIRCQGGMR